MTQIIKDILKEVNKNNSNVKGDYMFVWLTRDSSGLVQMWRDKPEKYKFQNKTFFVGKNIDKESINIECFFNDFLSKEVCCIKYCLVKSKSDEQD